MRIKVRQGESLTVVYEGAVVFSMKPSDAVPDKDLRLRPSLQSWMDRVPESAKPLARELCRHEKKLIVADVPLRVFKESLNVGQGEFYFQRGVLERNGLLEIESIVPNCVVYKIIV